MTVILGTCCDLVCILAKEVNSNPVGEDGWVASIGCKDSNEKF
jgi:hypothetical protein